VLDILMRALLNPKRFDQSFDIGGPDILTYKEIFRFCCSQKNFKKMDFTKSVMTKLSSYWLYFVTSTSCQIGIGTVSSV
jgi:ATP-dependent Zn protease